MVRAGVSGYVFKFELCGDENAHGPPAGMEDGDWEEMESVNLRLTGYMIQKNLWQAYVLIVLNNCWSLWMFHAYAVD